MGIKKLYKTNEEVRISINEKSMRYYLKNKELIQKKNLKRYYDKKQK
jgi:hypothetical protein